ncbi:MAG: peptidoglycan-binding domain-containing protein [bacterium]
MKKIIHFLKLSRILSIIFLIFVASLFLPTLHAIGGEARNIRYESMLRQQQIRAQYNLIKAVQGRLIENGYDPGPVDGINGPRTQKALKAFQRDHGLVADGIPGKKTLESLGLNE